jgi:putative flippase GtrA
MNYPRIVLAGLAAWLASIALGYLINDVWLFRLYQANAWAFRRPSDIAALLAFGLGAQLVACFAFAITYAKGYEGEGSALGEGIRYGLLVALMVDGFAVVWNYVTEPIAPRLGVLELVARIGEFGVYGAVVGLIYRRREVSPPQVDF